MPNLRSLLIRRTVLAGTVMAIATAGAGGAYMHLAASPTPSAGASSAPKTPEAMTPGAKTHHHHHHGGGALRALVRDTAKQTNQTPEQVLAELKAGKTFDQIAGTKAATVKQDVLAQAKTRLDGAVSRGRIDGTKEAAMLAKLSTQLDALMNKNLAARLQHVGKHHAAGTEAPKATPNSGAPPAV